MRLAMYSSRDTPVVAAEQDHLIAPEERFRIAMAKQ